MTTIDCKKDNDITDMNVDDYIRERRKSGAKYIYWGENGWQRFTSFFEAAMSCGIGLDVNIPVIDL